MLHGIHAVLPVEPLAVALIGPAAGLPCLGVLDPIVNAPG
jgi:hypothetical protein